MRDVKSISIYIYYIYIYIRYHPYSLSPLDSSRFQACVGSFAVHYLSWAAKTARDITKTYKNIPNTIWLTIWLWLKMMVPNILIPHGKWTNIRVDNFEPYPEPIWKSMEGQTSGQIYTLHRCQAERHGFCRTSSPRLVANWRPVDFDAGYPATSSRYIGTL